MPPGDVGKPLESCSTFGTKRCPLVQEWWRKKYTVISVILGVQFCKDLGPACARKGSQISVKHANSDKDYTVLNIN